MKTLNNQGKKIFLLSLPAIVFVLGCANEAFAQAGIGAKYAARDPHLCQDRKPPRGSAIAADKAKEYFLCSEYSSGQNLYLYDEVTVQIGKPRPYNIREDVNYPNIDTTIPITPIRGSFKLFQCSLVSDYMQNKGKNCFVYDHQNAKGACYRDSYGDWNCNMTDVGAQLISQGAPPPGAGAAAATSQKAAVERKPAQSNPLLDPEPTESKTDTAAKDDNGYPEPDVSDMNKWYNITKIEYGDLATDQTFHFLFKPKVDHLTRGNPSLRFEAQYLDKDGVLIGSYPVYVEYSTEPGQTGKGEAKTPSEKEMAKVVSVKIVRIKQ